MTAAECMIPAESEIQEMYDPQHWPGDSGAVIEAMFDERAARYVNTWFDTVLRWTLINRDDINLPLFTADDIRALRALQQLP